MEVLVLLTFGGGRGGGRCSAKESLQILDLRRLAGMITVVNVKIPFSHLLKQAYTFCK